MKEQQGMWAEYAREIVRLHNNSLAASQPPGDPLFGRAMVVLKALQLSVKWELAPEIKGEIWAICEEFEARRPAPQPAPEGGK